MKKILILVTLQVIASSSYALVGNSVKVADEKYSAIGQINEDCTATLITPKILVTAAHCVIGNKPSDLKIKFMNQAEAVQVVRAIIPNYIRNTSPIGRGQDIALLEIKEEMGR